MLFRSLAIALTHANERVTYSFFDARDEKVWSAIVKAFPGEQVDFVSAAAGRKLVVVRVFGQHNGAAFMLVHMDTGQAELVGDMYAKLPPEEIAETRPISYTAADGLKIPAYLTLPRNRPAKELPLVVAPHGAFNGRDVLAFNWLVQALASRGYAVLQPEFRGSSVNGELRAAGFGEWGRKMQTDISDGVADLAKQGIVDPKRACIVGGSYGGYAALAGVTLDKGVYRCAVSIAGYADMKRFLEWQEGRLTANNSAIPVMERMLGVKSSGDPALTSLSPAKLADRASAPVLLIHGQDDTVVPIEQSQAMAEALKAAGKPVELVTLSGEDHSLLRSESRTQLLTAAVRFLEANNPPDPPAQRTAAAAP